MQSQQISWFGITFLWRRHVYSAHKYGKEGNDRKLQRRSELSQTEHECLPGKYFWTWNPFSVYSTRVLYYAWAVTETLNKASRGLRKWVSDLYQVPVWTGGSCFVSVSLFKARSWTRFIEDCSAWNGYLNSVMWRRLIWPSFVIHCGKDILFDLCEHISDHVHSIWVSFASLLYGKQHSGLWGRKRQCFTKQDVLSGFNWAPSNFWYTSAKGRHTRAGTPVTSVYWVGC